MKNTDQINKLINNKLIKTISDKNNKNNNTWGVIIKIAILTILIKTGKKLV